MSLLDQLSSLCSISTNNNNFISSLYGIYNQPDQQKNKSFSRTPAKIIQLFDDKQISAPYKSNKKTQNNSANQTLFKCLDVKAQFTINSTDQLAKLTKMTFLLKNKLRKIDYQFFVKLESYSKFIQKQILQEQKIKQQKSNENYVKGFNKLVETTNILKLKYYKDQKQQQGIKQQKKILQTFKKLKNHMILSSKLSCLIILQQKLYFRMAWVKIQNFNIIKIKMEIFQNTFSRLIIKRKQKALFQFYKSLIQSMKHLNKEPIKDVYLSNQFLYYQNNHEQFQRQDYQNNQIQYQRQDCQNQFKQILLPHIPIQLIHMRMNYPLQLNYFKTQESTFRMIKSNFQESHQAQFQCQFQQRNKKQNIPLQLNSLKSHQEQINLNDCIDNGHLLMNQITRNKIFMSLRKQTELQNLTISKIGSHNHTNNTQLNSSALTYEGFILPQFNYEQVKPSEEQDQTKPSTMRKKSNQDPMLKNIKKPRSSLVITKRKQSTSGIILTGSEKNSLHGSFSNNKTKTNSINNKKTVLNKQHEIKDKQFLKKMLEELNKKYVQNSRSSNKKTLQIDRSSSKKTSENKKKSNEQSGTKAARKKIKSQFLHHPSIKEEVQYTQNCETVHKETKNFFNLQSKPLQECFMPVKLNQMNKYLPLGSQSLSNKQKKKQEALKSTINSIKKHLNYDPNVLKQQKNKVTSVKTSLQKNNQNRIKIDLTNKQAIKKQQKIENQKYDRKKQNDFLQYKRLSSNYDKNIQKNSWQQNMNHIFSDNTDVNYLNHFKKSQYQNQQDQFYKQSKTSYLSDFKKGIQFSNNQQYLPSFVYVPENPNASSIVYESQMNSYCVSNNPQQSYRTGSRVSLGPNKNIRESLDRKRKSFEKSFEQWDGMFQKQKSKFNKKQIKTSAKLSSLNSSVINQIRAKIERCIISDTNNTNKIHHQQKYAINSRKNSSIITLKPFFCKERQIYK